LPVGVLVQVIVPSVQFLLLLSKVDEMRSGLEVLAPPGRSLDVITLSREATRTLTSSIVIVVEARRRASKQVLNPEGEDARSRSPKRVVKETTRVTNFIDKGF
jgi:hypothetical protein